MTERALTVAEERVAETECLVRRSLRRPAYYGKIGSEK